MTINAKRTPGQFGTSVLVMVKEAPLVFFLGPVGVGVLALLGLSLHPAALGSLLLAWLCSIISFHGSRTSNARLRVLAGVGCAAFGAVGLAAVQVWM